MWKKKNEENTPVSKKKIGKTTKNRWKWWNVFSKKTTEDQETHNPPLFV